MVKPSIVFQTDFGLGGGGAMYGVCKQVDPDLRFYELTHTIPTFDVVKASLSLRDAMTAWPKGTVFVSVVDPGVGTARRASIARTANGYYITTPDNGSLTYPLLDFGIQETRQIDETVNRYHGTENTSIFHGRDLFAYCAARLAAGVIDFEGVGPAYPVSEIVTFPVPKYVVAPGEASGCVTGALASFGNLDTSIPAAAMAQTGLCTGSPVRLTLCHGEEVLFDRPVRYQESFAGAPAGTELLFHNYSGFLGIAVSQGSFAQRYQVGAGPDWTVTVRKAE
ncbi:MAG: S-adenosyl-l-methionine hydroxide adenosyltransferase family protein [Candidatus Onthomonas sp.]